MQPINYKIEQKKSQQFLSVGIFFFSSRLWEM